MLNSPNTLESGSPLHPHFTEGETEALKDEIGLGLEAGPPGSSLFSELLPAGQQEPRPPLGSGPSPSFSFIDGCYL